MITAPLATAVKSLYGALAMTGLTVRLVGVITTADPKEGWFMLCDGSPQPVKVYCQDSTYTGGLAIVTGRAEFQSNPCGRMYPVVRVPSAETGIILLSPPNYSGDWSIWTETSLQKVMRTDSPGPTQSAKLSAARNEHEAFQIVLRPGKDPIRCVHVIPSELKGPKGSIPACHVTPYRPCYIYLPYYERYAPDPLPECDRVFDVRPGQTQPIWIDVYVPEDAPPGDYTGSVRVAATNERAVDVPVSLHVYDFTLPRESKLTTQFDFYDYYMAPKEGVEHGSKDCMDLWRKYYEFLLDHGVSTSLPPVEDFTSAEAASYLMDPRLTSFRIPRHPDPKVQRALLNQVKTCGALSKGYWDVVDEPYHEKDFDLYKQRSSQVRSMDPNAKCLLTYYDAKPAWAAPKHVTDLLAGYVQIWCAHGGAAFETDRLAARAAKGEKVWMYQATNPDGIQPNFLVQDPTISHRVIPWECYLYGASGWLYWHTNYWADVSDPWTDICTGKNLDRRLYGEGSLVYPGRYHLGKPGPVSSIRLEAFRDGLEDYKYIWLLERKIGRTATLRYVKRAVQDWMTYTRDPERFEGVRNAIAQAIEYYSRPAIVQPEPIRPNKPPQLIIIPRR